MAGGMSVTGTVPGYSPERATAIHEACDAVMAYLLGRPFTEISIVGDGETNGRVRHRLPGHWFRPDIEINARTRTMIEDRVIILLAGGEAEAAWCSWRPDAPEGWRELVDQGAGNDVEAAVNIADRMGGESPPETGA